jgi:ATP-dependent RNA helicase DeaD
MPDESLPESPQQLNSLLHTMEVSATAIVSEPVESLLAEYTAPRKDGVALPDQPPQPTQENVSSGAEPVVAAPVVDKKSTRSTTFEDLPLSDDVKSAVRASGYDKPTAIQSEIIPHMAAGRDVLAQSQTGTGKTAAFALPILSKIKSPSKKPQVLVLTPTRELAIQVAASFTTYGNCLPNFSVATIYGGQDYEIQLRQLRRGVQVVVGTPGRVIDLIRRGTLDLSKVECVVLDEADEMLNMGFLEDVEFVLKQTPQQRQIALFSATLPEPIRQIAKRYLNDPARITIKKKTMTADSIRQRALFVAPKDKIDVLRRILEVEASDGVIVFTKTKDATVSVADQLIRAGLSAVALNGDMPQKVRQRTIEGLKSGRLDILVATDVAARGLDVTRVSHVFNYDLPHDSESYIHRVGRTGRAGRKGEAIIFLTNAQRGKLRLIERATKQPIEVMQPPTAEQVNSGRVRRFTDRITETIATEDLSLFKKMISEYVDESGQPALAIAAALAQIGQEGRPFLIKDRPKNQSDHRDRKDQDRQQRRTADDDRHEPDFRDGDSYSPRSDSRRTRTLGPPQPGMTRYRIAVGRNDGVKPGNIVGAVANEAGIDGEFIGPIAIHDSFSTVDLPQGLPREIYETLKRTRVAGKQLRLNRSDEATHGGQPNRNENPRHKKRRDQQVTAGGNTPRPGKFKKKKKIKASR